MIILVFPYLVSAATIISQCGNITSSGAYVLNQSITNAGTCLRVWVDNVEIDCNGSTIKYNTGGLTTLMGIDAINGTIARTNLTVKNCILIKPSSSQTAGYGIRLTRFSNSRLINNTIYTNGTTNNYGIFLTTNSQNNLIENNTVYSNGSGAGNAGIYLITGCSNNTIKNNRINTSGAGTGHGIYISGLTNVSDNNTVSSNTISTSGTGATNDGIYLTTNVNYNNVTGNNIITNGTTTNHGIYLGGASGTPVNNNEISNNSIQTFGTLGTVTTYGIYLQNYVNKNNIFDNNIITHGTTNDWGIYLTGTAALTVNSNVIDSNTVQTTGTTTGDYGVYLLTNANFNNVTNNIISTYGSSANYGVYISGNTFACNYNVVSFNNISTSGTAGSNYGVYFYRNVNSNVVSGNNVSTNGTTSDYGIYIVGTTGLSVDNNVIDSNNINATGAVGASTNYGVVLSSNADFNNVTHNNITTQGTTANYGIYVTGTAALTANSNIIDSNTVRTIGTTTNNWGVTLITNVNSDIVTNNIISTYGSSANYGVYISGNTFACNYNVVSFNNISTSGTADSNYGVYLYRNVNSNIVSDNNVSTKGTTLNYGIYAVGTAALTVNSNIIDSNIIQTLGSITNNYGVYLLTNANFNNVTNNNISTNGSTGNIGVVLSGATAPSIGNFVFDNIIRTFGSTGNYGVELTANSNSNNVSGNDIITNGTLTNPGIYLLGAAGTPVNNNEISYNTLQTRCSSASSNCHGIFLQTLVTNTSIIGNSITTGGTTINYGIYLLGTAALPVNTNIFDSNTLNVSKSDRINIGSFSQNNTVRNNLIINRNYSYYDFNISAAGVNGTAFIDQYLENYTFTGSGGLITVQNSSFGKIVFLYPVNGSGANFSKDINISYNHIYVNSSKSGLNKSALLTLYDLTFNSPVILRDNSTCADCVILNYTNGDLLFNVSHFSTYSAAENPNPPVIDSMIINDSIDPENEIILSAGAIRTVHCVVSVSDPLGIGNIIGANATFYYDQNLSSDTDNNLVHYTDTSCGLNQTNSTDKIFSCDFDIWYYANNGTWNCNATAYNNQSALASSNMSTVIDALYAINISDGLSFGNVESNVASNNITANITNLGNVPLNISLQGYSVVPGDSIGMNCSDNTNITITNIRFTKNPLLDYNQKTSLDGSIQYLNFTLQKQKNITVITNSTYWQIMPNPGSKNRFCEGFIIFSAEIS